MKRLCTFVLGLALVFTSAQAATPGSAMAAEQASEHKVATLGADDHPTGFPSQPDVAYLQLASADFDLDLTTGEFSGRVGLEGYNTLDGPTVFWTVGTFTGTRCVSLSSEFHAEAVLDQGFASGALPGGWAEADCAVAILSPDGDSNNVVDALVGPLTSEVEAPRLSVGKVQLLGSPQLKLVRGTWTTVDVVVANDGDLDVESYTITGRGKGLKVKAVTSKVGVSADDTWSSRMQVKLVGSRATTMKLTVTGDGATASKSVKVTPRRAPARPASGRYASKDGDVTFTISNGRIRNFTGSVVMTCGVYPQYTYPTQQHTFPGAPTVARSGIVDTSVEKNEHYYELQLFATGSRVTKGYFFVNGASYCTGGETFSAKRVGR